MTLYDYAQDSQRAENAVITEKIQTFEGKLSVLTEERDTLYRRLEEVGAAFSNSRAEFERTIHASAHTQAYLVNELQQVSQKLELAEANLAKIQNTRIYKYLVRCI